MFRFEHLDARASTAINALNEKQDRLDELYDMSSMDRRHADFGQGIVVFSRGGVVRLVADAVPLGYHEAPNGRWNWSWATRWSRRDARERTKRLKGLGSAVDVPLFDRPHFVVEKAVAEFLVAVSCERVGALGFCSFSDGTARGYVALTRIARIAGVG